MSAETAASQTMSAPGVPEPDDEDALALELLDAAVLLGVDDLAGERLLARHGRRRATQVVPLQAMSAEARMPPVGVSTVHTPSAFCSALRTSVPNRIPSRSPYSSAKARV